MDLSLFFSSLAVQYDRHAPLDSPAQKLLASAGGVLAPHAPIGIVVRGSGGKGIPTFTPWVGFFDPDETTDPQRGLYVVYALSADGETLALTLNQGIEELRRDLGDAKARIRLAADAEAISAGLL